MLKKHNLISIIVICISLASSPVHAKGATDESAIFQGFTSLASDVLILLDASQGMLLNPAGGTETWGTSSCSGPFSASPDGTNNTDCSRLAIAKRAVFSMLDSSQNGVIDSSDSSSLNVRFGYMRFTACGADDTGASYASGCNEVIWPIGTNYSTIYCNATSCTATSGSSTADCVNSESASGGSALASALNEAKLYLGYSKSNDTTASECRMKSVLLITAGEDTLSCGGNGQANQADQYKRRRNSVAMAKALADAGYKLYVVGFGTNMPAYVRNTLNWMGYYGKTQNTNLADSGDKSAFNPTLNGACVESLPTTSCGTSGLATCAASNDPGTASLSGFAFFADNTSALAQMLSQTIGSIRAVDYSFATASVASSRVKDENNIYEGSLTYVSNDPFWQGHLKKYDINADGTVGAAVWDAGSVLASTSSSSRTIYTLKTGGLVAFTTGNITPQDLGYTSSDTPSRDKAVGYIRGDSSNNPDGWKLGDVFRSTPMTIGSPSPYYQDIRDTSTCTWIDSGATKSGNAFDCFRAAHQRTSAGGDRLILVGANDGQLHAFKTSDGTEAWSIIPPNLLPKLQTIVHTSHPATSQLHQYFVDGPVSVADIWLGSGDGTSKSSSGWKTLMVFGEGRGASSSYLWSSSSSCDSGFNATYTTTYKYYCGFYAFDVSNSLSPVYQWHLNPNADQAPYLGDPWGKFFIGRVKKGGDEKWVGFIGGGYNSADCKTGNTNTCDTRGKGFFVVDLSDGSILWSYTRASNGMDYSLAGSPAIVDTDNDGFIDTVYIGDLGGNMWRFKFCSSSAGSSCGITNWSGGKLFAASSGEIRPIYTTPSVARDSSGNIWVYWGTGDKSDPTASNAQEKMYAVKDNDRTTQYTISSLENISSDSSTYSGSGAGWFMNLSGSGQKILADPTVFGGVLYFTVYTPGDNRVCSQAGTADLFGVTATTGGGIFSSGRSMSIGSGIPTAPVISFKAGGSPDMYVTVSGGAGVTANTQRVNFNPPGVSNRSSVIYWRDRRVR